MAEPEITQPVPQPVGQPVKVPQPVPTADVNPPHTLPPNALRWLLPGAGALAGLGAQHQYVKRFKPPPRRGPPNVEDDDAESWPEVEQEDQVIEEEEQRHRDYEDEGPIPIGPETDPEREEDPVPAVAPPGYFVGPDGRVWRRRVPSGGFTTVDTLTALAAAPKAAAIGGRAILGLGTAGAGLAATAPAAATSPTETSEERAYRIRRLVG